jgi:hypothetical protein
MTELVWYLAMNIKPDEGEDVLVFDHGTHYIAYWTAGDAGSRGYWSDYEEMLTFSPEAYWTDLPVPP